MSYGQKPPYNGFYSTTIPVFNTKVLQYKTNMPTVDNSRMSIHSEFYEKHLIIDYIFINLRKFYIAIIGQMENAKSAKNLIFMWNPSKPILPSIDARIFLQRDSVSYENPKMLHMFSKIYLHRILLNLLDTRK